MQGYRDDIPLLTSHQLVGAVSSLAGLLAPTSGRSQDDDDQDDQDDYEEDDDDHDDDDHDDQ